MKTLTRLAMLALFGMLLIFTLAMGTAFGSEYEKGKGKKYERYENEFYGTIERLPDGLIGIWSVSGQQVEVTKDTYIKEEHGKANVGAYVEVKGRKEGGKFKAYKIEVKRLKR